MTQVEMNQQTAQILEDFSKRAEKSIDELILFWADNFGYAVIEAGKNVADADVTWTEEELAELLKPKKPLTGKQIAEKHLKSGVIGSWSDVGITDSAEWVNEQKEKRRDKYKW